MVGLLIFKSHVENCGKTISFSALPLELSFFQPLPMQSHYALEHFKCIKLTVALSALCALCVTGQKGHQIGRIDM